MSKQQLDEMQLQKRNKIGNQSFMLLSYLLMLDIGLSGFGVRWLSYPVNVFVIMMVCMGINLVRVIWNNAYTGPGTGRWSAAAVIVFGGAALVAAILVLVLNKAGIVVQSGAADQGDNGSIILVIVSVVALLIAAIVGVINYRRNKTDDKS